MTTPQTRLQDIQARALNERIIDYGLCQGLLDALRLAYERMKDGSLVIHFPRQRGLWRIQPPGVGEASGLRVISLGDDGRLELSRITVALRWEEDTADWVLQSGEPEIAAEVWKTMARLAREAGWLESRAA